MGNCPALDSWKTSICITGNNGEKLLGNQISDFHQNQRQAKDQIKDLWYFEDAWNLASLDTEISMLVKKNFVNSIVRTMLDDKCKIIIDSLLCNATYSFKYNVKTTEPEEFPDQRIFYVDNF